MVGQTLSFCIYSTPEWQCVGIKEGIAGRNGQSEHLRECVHRHLSMEEDR